MQVIQGDLKNEMTFHVHKLEDNIYNRLCFLNKSTY